MNADTLKKVQRTKTCIYLLLVVATIFFANRSFHYFDNELEQRTIPQVVRAAVQISKLLPQLEANEQAVREVFDNLQSSRHQIYQNNEDSFGQQQTEENAETIISDTLSWMNRVTKLRVGREGHVIVISRDDHSILAHTDEQFIGDVLNPENDVDMSAIPDISQIGEGQTADVLHLFLPSSLNEFSADLSHYFDAVNAGIYGTAFTYKDTIILCGVTLREAFYFVLGRSFLTTLFFFTIAWFLVRYIGFALIWQKAELKEYRTRITSYSLFALVIVFIVTWYYATIMDVTGDIATMNRHANVAIETLNTYRDYRDELSQWLDNQYLDQCYLVRELIIKKGRDNITRKDLAKFANDLNVRYIYIYDKNGKVMVTNSPYDHLELSDKETDLSYAFRQLLDGREYLIQEPQTDTYGEKLQYIGVSFRNSEDLADGFVQIAVAPTLREQLLSPINIQTVLDNMVIGLPDYALAVDKDTLQIVCTTGLGYANSSIEDLGIKVEDLKNGYNRSFIINGLTYYVAVSESEDLFLIPLARSTDNSNALHIALKLMVITAVVFLVFILVSVYGYSNITKMKESGDKEDSVSEEAANEETDDVKEPGRKRIIHRLTGVIKEKNKFNFETRWKSQNSIPVEQQTPEMRARRIAYHILLIYSAAFVLFEILNYNEVAKDHLEGFSYVILGNWQKGLNLFSFSYCLFLLCVLYVFQELINQILYRIAKVTDLRNETILLLLRNALKYSCALIFLYMGLAKFGVDTKALWASAGVLSLMIGFGAKDLISDVIAGLFIIFEGTYKIGDFVMINNWIGTVEEIGIRYTKISYFSDTKIINNSSIRDIVNSDGEVAREVLKIPIPYKVDLLELEQLLASELPKMEENIPGLVKPLRYQGVTALDDNCMRIRIAIFCTSNMRKKALRALEREIKLLFDRENINISCGY